MESIYIPMSLSLSNISITTRLQLGVVHGIDGEEDPNADDP